MAKFLIVDDSSLDRLTLKKCINSLGHDVIAETEKGLEALDMYKNFMPDIVILDIIMPDLNGIEVLKQIIDHDKNSIIIMCTSATTTISIMDAAKIGAKSFISKPINFQSVSKVLKSLKID